MYMVDSNGYLPRNNPHDARYPGRESLVVQSLGRGRGGEHHLRTAWAMGCFVGAW